ncbi:MAG: ParM/StbA family protein [Candidatus Uhrbacteria bacterium]|nr:ParM/StbA family protein [Candidatus Uhrbacteria bacterium]
MRRIIGVDLGFGFCKVLSDNGIHIFPSVIGPCDDAALKVSGLKNPAFEHETVFLDNRRYLIGESAIKYADRIYLAREKDWMETSTYRCLLYHSLRLAGVYSNTHAPEDIVIATGLPVTHYRSCRGKLVELIKKMAHPDISVKVTLQPLGSYFDYFLDDNGVVLDRELISGRIGIIDIGFYTTDYVTVEDLDLVKNLLDTSEGGMSSVYQDIARDIYSVYGVKKEVHEVEQVLRDGYVKVYGEKKEVADLVRPRLDSFAREIESTARVLWKDGAAIDRILITGGGAEALKSYLDFYKHTVFVPESQIANVRGYVKFAGSLRRHD